MWNSVKEKLGGGGGGEKGKKEVVRSVRGKRKRDISLWEATGKWSRQYRTSRVTVRCVSSVSSNFFKRHTLAVLGASTPFSSQVTHGATAMHDRKAQVGVLGEK
jgi:hypothetical protein